MLPHLGSSWVGSNKLLNNRGWVDSGRVSVKCLAQVKR